MWNKALPVSRGCRSRDASADRMDDGRRLCSVHTRRTQNAPQLQTTCTCSRSEVIILNILEVRTHSPEDEKVLPERSWTRRRLWQLQRSQRILGRWPCSPVFLFHCGESGTFWSWCTKSEAAREVWPPEKDFLMSQGQVLHITTLGGKRVLPISLESGFHISGKSSSFHLEGPDAQSMRSSILPGKAPNMTTQLSHS